MKKNIIVFAMIIFFAGCFSALNPMQQRLQRREIESRSMKGTFEDAFRATLQVFQDNGYIIKSTDHASGVIQGETGFKKIWYLNTMSNREITATIEQFGEGIVKERLTLVEKTKTNTEYGVQENSKIIYKVELFQRMYDDIQQEMFIRQNLNK